MTQENESLLRDARLARRHLDRIAKQLEESSGVTARADDAVNVARQMLERRKSRSEYFPAALFGDPVWDLMLALYMSQADGNEVYSYALFRACSIAPTTGLRVLEKLEAAAMITRSPSHSDRRQLIVRFSEDAFERMTTMLSRMHRV